MRRRFSSPKQVSIQQSFTVGSASSVSERRKVSGLFQSRGRATAKLPSLSGIWVRGRKQVSTSAECRRRQRSLAGSAVGPVDICYFEIHERASKPVHFVYISIKSEGICMGLHYKERAVSGSLILIADGRRCWHCWRCWHVSCAATVVTSTN